MPRKRTTHEVDSATIEENAQSPEMAMFAKTLNTLLVEKSIHQEDMAQALGVATGSISSWRNGKKEPRLSMIVKIADYLGVDCHYLMTGVQAKNYVCSNELGLSEKAIEKLKECPGFYAWRLKEGERIPTYTAVQALNFLIESAQLEDFGSALASVLQYSDSSLFNSTPIDVSQDEIDRVLDFLEEKGRSTMERKKLAELELQLACDTLKEIFRMKGEVRYG